MIIEREMLRMKNDLIVLHNQNCFDAFKYLEDNSINLILMDPPYNIGKSKDWDTWKSKNEYVEFMGGVFLECQRVLKSNGCMYWFHNDMVQISMLMEWLRINTNFAFNSFIVLDKGDWRGLSWKNPTENNNLRCFFNTCEYCLLYVNGDCLQEGDSTGWDKIRLDTNKFVNLRQYSLSMLEYIAKQYLLEENNKKYNNIVALGKKLIFEKIGGKADHFTRYKSTQFSLCTKETYNEIIETFKLDKWEGFRTYESLKNEYEELRLEYEQLRFIHNLDKDHKNIFEFKRDKGENFHPCQKPINILERLIRTSTNEGDTVLDCFMGSGSTGVACVNTNRKFIGIEYDKDYFNISKQRITTAINEKE